jgi:hypothetical protein
LSRNHELDDKKVRADPEKEETTLNANSCDGQVCPVASEAMNMRKNEMGVKDKGLTRSDVRRVI